VKFFSNLRKKVSRSESKSYDKEIKKSQNNKKVENFLGTICLIIGFYKICLKAKATVCYCMHTIYLCKEHNIQASFPHIFYSRHTAPYAENKVEHKMNLVQIGHKEKKFIFQWKIRNVNIVGFQTKKSA
jgi:hypothetical protein